MGGELYAWDMVLTGLLIFISPRLGAAYLVAVGSITLIKAGAG